MTQVNWHPYPKERPAKHETYLVTVESVWGNRYVAFDFYRGRWDNFSRIVIAWAELPEPYEQEGEDNETK